MNWKRESTEQTKQQPEVVEQVRIRKEISESDMRRRRGERKSIMFVAVARATCHRMLLHAPKSSFHRNCRDESTSFCVLSL